MPGCKQYTPGQSWTTTSSRCSITRLSRLPPATAHWAFWREAGATLSRRGILSAQKARECGNRKIGSVEALMRRSLSLSKDPHVANKPPKSAGTTGSCVLTVTPGDAEYRQCAHGPRKRLRNRDAVFQGRGMHRGPHLWSPAVHRPARWWHPDIAASICDVHDGRGIPPKVTRPCHCSCSCSAAPPCFPRRRRT